ncbi:TRAP transporter small permease [Oricola sp.]|uniref:TRAP transporter small permease n=1 Tax=Oricola sp. TaxID=1979950 RepID=UPI003514D06F
MLDRIDRILEWWSRALRALAVLAGFAMMIHVTFDVFMRTVMHSPLRQTNQTVAAYYMIAATFLPIAFLGLRDDHISADIFTEYMGPRLRRWLDAFTTFLGIAYMVAFTWQSYESALRRTAQGEVLEISGGYMIVWPGRWLLPIAGASLLLCLTLRFVRILLPGRGPNEQHHARIPDA